MTRLLFALAACCLALAAYVPAAGAQPASNAPVPGTDARLFAVEVKVGPKWDSSKPPGEQAFFREHSANLRQLREAGHILLGARYSDKGLLVFTAPSAAAVRAMMDQDPSIAHGTFGYEVHDFNVFYPGAVQAPARRAQ